MSTPILRPTPNRVGMPILKALRNCMVTSLLQVDRPVCYLPLLVSDAPLPAQRCDCTCANNGQGEGWVRLARSERAQITAPGQPRNRRSTSLDSALADCTYPVWEMTVETGVWRCAPTLDSTTGEPPSDEEYDTHTQGLLNDTAALTRTWKCCDWLSDNVMSYQLDAAAPSGPSGGCVGVVATGRIRVEDCYPCP